MKKPMTGIMIAIGKPDMKQAPEQKGIRIPISALSQDDGSGNAVAPAAGDSVDFSVTGEVESIDGSHAVINPKTINGQEIPYNEPEANTEAEEEANMREAGAKEDAMGSY